MASKKENGSSYQDRQQGRTNLKSHIPQWGPCLVRPGLPDDGGVHHEKSLLDNDLINLDQEVSQLYCLDKDDNLDSNLLIEETLSGNEEFYDDVEQQSNSNVVEEQSNSSLDQYHESSIAHIDLTEEYGTILDVDDPS
ncbi:hypothetical protein KY290_000994 [Solanum tuberosum]|uniref:Uncharacterized protein n=1 Tax=Solanum tuberosum TaxID=4113 RepID=A0ABQ7WM95_SOLTU|nr:hypothetical protein KY290_000994 [Solanum tuberosum]